MKIVLLDRSCTQIVYIDVDDAMIWDGDTEGWLNEHGYDNDRYSWFAVTADYIPVEMHRYAVHKGDGGDVHETCNEKLRFGTPYNREKDLKNREWEECGERLLAVGEEDSGGYEKHFDVEKPIVAGYLYDEPCDIVVNAVRFKDGGITILGYDKNDPYTEQEIDVSELFAGQLNEITERI